jgi:hypothetical protein
LTKAKTPCFQGDSLANIDHFRFSSKPEFGFQAVEGFGDRSAVALELTGRGT